MTTPTTIVELRTTLLQVPWRGKPPAAGILSAPFRDFYVLEIETQGAFYDLYQEDLAELMRPDGGLDDLPSSKDVAGKCRCAAGCTPSMPA